MDICSWNWGAIGSMVSTLIPSAVALYIFSKWKHQKNMKYYQTKPQMF